MQNKRTIRKYPDEFGHGGSEYVCNGKEQCSGCTELAKPGEKRIWETGMDQDNLWCLNCAKIRC